MLRKHRGTAVGAVEEVIYKNDIPANRYDVLCLGGIARALSIFLGRTPAPACADATGPECLTVKAETALVRPFVVAAVLQGVANVKAGYDSFFGLQQKLHQNLCRQRTHVAIGTHDLDTPRCVPLGGVRARLSVDVQTTHMYISSYWSTNYLAAVFGALRRIGLWRCIPLMFQSARQCFHWQRCVGN